MCSFFNTELIFTRRYKLTTNGHGHQALLIIKTSQNVFFLELKDAVSDLLISTESYRSVIVVSEKSSVFLCFIGIYKKICIIAKCKEIEKSFTNNNPKRKGTEDMQFSFANIWKLWKGKVQASINHKITNMLVYLFRFILVFSLHDQIFSVFSYDISKEESCVIQF